MPVRFIPTGQLDITTDATLLPEESSDKMTVSDALTRCTNLRLGHKGMARNRWGSAKLNATAVDTDINLIVEHEGDRYTFAAGYIYKNEVAIASGLTDADWTAMIYNQYNSTYQSIFALNGTERKRITSGVVHEWGVDAPDVDPQVNPTALCTHAWEKAYFPDCAQYGITAGDYQVTSLWEAAYIDESAITIPSTPTISLQSTTDGDCTNGTHAVAVSYLTSNGETQMSANAPEVTVDDNHKKIDVVLPLGGTNVVGRNVYMTIAENVSVETGSCQSGSTYYLGETMLTLIYVPTALTTADTITITHGTSVRTYAIAAIRSPLYGGTNNQQITLATGLLGTLASLQAVTLNYNSTTYGYFKVATINDNTTTSYTINVADGDISLYNNVILYQYYFEATADSGLGASEVYGVKYTYVRKEGDSVVFESSASDAVSYTTIDATYPMIVFYGLPADEQITHVRIYRTLDGAAVYYYDVEIDQRRSQAVLNHTDAQLGSQVETDHDRPPLGSTILGPNYGGVSFILKDNLVYFSSTSRPEYWPADYYVEASTKDYPLIAGTFLDTQLYVGSKKDIYLITMGTGAITSKAMNSITGTQSRQVFMGVKGHGLFHLGNDGLYQLTGSQYQPLYQGEGSDNNITNLNFRPIWEGETVGTIPGMNLDNIANCFLTVYKSKVFFGYPGLGSTYCDNMLVFGLIHRKAVHYQYPVAFRTLAVDYTNTRLLAADTEGYIWQIEDMDLTTDNGTAISWYLQSKDFTLFKKMFPRTARYDVEVGTSATGYILLNGVSKQTHTLTGQRANKRRLITGCTGDRLAIRLEGTGTVKIHKVEIE